MLAFYYSLFGVLTLLCAFLQYLARRKAPQEHPSSSNGDQPTTTDGDNSKPFLSFQRYVWRYAKKSINLYSFNLTETICLCISLWWVYPSTLSNYNRMTNTKKIKRRTGCRVRMCMPCIEHITSARMTLPCYLLRDLHRAWYLAHSSAPSLINSNYWLLTFVFFSHLSRSQRKKEHVHCIRHNLLPILPHQTCAWFYSPLVRPFVGRYRHFPPLLLLWILDGIWAFQSTPTSFL